jgi:hypothetical protein
LRRLLRTSPVFARMAAQSVDRKSSGTDKPGRRRNGGDGDEADPGQDKSEESG